MTPLNCLYLLFLFISLSKSEISLEQKEPKDLLRTKLETKLSTFKASENEVTYKQPQPKVDLLKDQAKPEYPVAFRSEEPPCPNFNNVLNDLKTSLQHLTQLFNGAISIITDTLNNPKYQCQMSLNPLSPIKCVLRIFAASYKQLTVLWTEVSALRQDISKMLDEYQQYSTKCNKNWTFGNTLQLLDLYKFVEGFIKDA